MAERRWISRDEIAQIHDSIANSLARQQPPNETDEGFNARLDHYASHRQTANEIRQIDGIGQFAGQVKYQSAARNYRDDS